ncbi:MAG: copper chaperone PCu(A)C [Pseudomonadota bacterium]
MRLLVGSAIAAAMLAGCQPQPPHVENAWIRLPAVQGRPAAAYFTLDAGQQAQTLLSIRTPAAVRAELHESMAGHGNMMSMKPLGQVAVPADGTVAFAPAGKHVMLFDVNPALKAGGTTTLTLAFADGRTIEATAEVVGAGDPAP